MKTIKYSATLAVVALMGVSLTSCGGYSNGKAKEMIAKDNDGKLEQADYTEMIDWVDNFNNEYNDAWEGVIEDSKDYNEYELSKMEMEANLAPEYVFIGKVSGILNKQSYKEEAFGKENVDKWKEVNQKNNDRQDALADKAPKRK